MNRYQRHNLIAEILQSVISANPEDRDATIAELCDGDEELVQEVRSLLKHEPQAQSLLDTPIVDANAVIVYRPEVFGSGTIQIPGFKLQRVLGQGASSIVYHAIQENPQREVAIKVLRPLSCSQQATSRIQAEAHLLARLEHPSIARIYQVGVIESQLHAQPFLVMEYALGDPLSIYFKDHEITFNQRIDLLVNLCDIFEYAHQNGVVHRDIKPSNILIHKDPQSDKLIPTVIDFGIAKLIHGQSIPIDIQTINPEIFGTLRYMSPERRSGQSSGDAVSSDIFSIGVLAAEVLGATLNCEHSAAIYENESGDSSSTLSPPIAKVLCRMIHPDPSMRFETVQEAADTLVQAVGASNQPLSGFEKFFQKHSRTKIASRAVTIAGLFLVIMVLPGSVFVSEFANQKELERGHIAGIPGAITKALEDSQAETQDQEISEQLARLNAHIRMIGEHARNGFHKEASRNIEIVESEFGDMSEVPAQYKQTFLFSKGYALTQNGNFNDALPVYQSAAELMNLNGELTEQLANDWRGVAHGIQTCGDYQTARQMYQQLIDHRSFSRLNWSLQSKVQSNLAGLYWLEQDYTTAEQMFREIIDSGPQKPSSRERKDLGQFYSSLGVVLTSSNKLEEGERHIKHALELTLANHRISDPVVCRMYRNLSKNYFHQGEYEKCISQMTFVRNVWAAMPDSWRYNLAEADFLLGSAYLESGDLEQALSYLIRADNSCLFLEGLASEKLFSKIQNALGAALCDSGFAKDGIALMESSLPSLISQYGVENLWVRRAMERATEHSDCQ